MAVRYVKNVNEEVKIVDFISPKGFKTPTNGYKLIDALATRGISPHLIQSYPLFLARRKGHNRLKECYITVRKKLEPCFPGSSCALTMPHI